MKFYTSVEMHNPGEQDYQYTCIMLGTLLKILYRGAHDMVPPDMHTKFPVILLNRVAKRTFTEARNNE